MAPKNRNGQPIQVSLTMVGTARQPTTQAGGRQDDALQTSTESHNGVPMSTTGYDKLWN
jgi:hypothetical protein